MVDIILYILERKRDFYLDEFEYPKEDERFCENVCTRINHIRELYRDFKEVSPDATISNSETLKRYFNRIKMIVPNFIGDPLYKELWKINCRN